MKILFLTFSLFLNFQTFAKDALTPVSLSAETRQFLALEKEIGENTYSLNYVSQLKLYNSTVNYLPLMVEEQELKELNEFAIKTLEVYEEPIFTPFEVIRSAKKLTKAQLEDKLNGGFFEVDADNYDVDVKLKEKLKVRAELKKKAIKEIVDFFFPVNENVKEVVMYDLLDNNNENVADAEFVIVSRNRVALMNSFYWL